MFVEKYFRQIEEGVSFSKEQGSRFAKEIAGDFNPLHDVDNKRFCVPGDLLFAATLSQFGISQSMSFKFKEMVSGDVAVKFTESDNAILLEGDNDKQYLTIAKQGESTKNHDFIETLIKNYVAFSGETFPGILVSLMKQEGVMINPDKPMVIYEMMQLDLSEFSDIGPEVVLTHSKLDVNGRRGLVIMEFDLRVDSRSIGQGKKQIIMGGLRPYEQDRIDWLVDYYAQRKIEYFS
ncbi:DUF3581 family protein [Aliikangiella sp. IMCC44359]|uniref:DUF3581 family protein n=1 Tax=Aliikangiella sp. IMCC44359 TaxID=3459125 RepID=UPI00403AD73D